MNIRRTATILGTVAFGAATLLGTGTAHAEPSDSNWGVHADGWDVQIHNEGRTDLELTAQPWGRNLDKASKKIRSGNTGMAKGKPSIFGGPANADVWYGGKDGDGMPVYYHVVLRADATGKYHNECKREGGSGSSLGCSVVDASVREPIQVYFY